MANPEHLDIIIQGVDVWNKWRNENPAIDPDLSEADLSNSQFQNINLRNAILTRALLNNASLIGAKLEDANLILVEGKNLNLAKANMSRVDFRWAKLAKANLKSATLYRGTFSDTDLQQSDLCSAVCYLADFSSARLNAANLINTNFRQANLVGANLSNAEITGTNLYGTAREDWIIDGVKCDYVFWDRDSENRIPKQRTFRPGEFAESYRYLPSIEYYFEQSFTPIDAILMDCIVQAINERHPEFELKLDSFHSRGQPHAVFTVLHKEVAEAALNQIKAGYEARIAKLEGERETLERCFNRALEEPRTIIKRIEMGDTYEIKGQAGAVGPGAHANDMNFNQAWNDISKDIDLTKLQAELVILREGIQREAKSSEQYQALAEVSDAEMAAKAGNGSRVVEHLKNAGKWSLKVAQDIGTDVAAEVIKKSLGL